MIVALGIAVFLFAIVYGLLGGAQSSFYNTDTSLELRNDLRIVFQKMEGELQYTGYNKLGVVQFNIMAGTGVNGSDIIRFSIPVVCDAASAFLDSSGVPAHWGAPLTWGCNSYTCMDADGSCLTVEYQYIQYSLNGSKQIVRTVLSPTAATVASQVIANDMTDLHAGLSGTRVLTLTITGQKRSGVGRMITASVSEKIRLRN
jgi:hypothetical protein